MNRFVTVVSIVVASGLLLSGVAHAQSGETAGAYDEAEAQAIDRMLMCPVCPAQTIDQTEVPLAKQMRAQVRELLSEGSTRREVLDWFSAPERYGPGVLAEPPRSGLNLIAWIVPGVVVVAALAGGVLTLRAMRRTPATATPTAAAAQSDDLQPYLDTVDRDLSLESNAGTGTDTERRDG